MEAGACACVGLPGLRWGQGLSSHHRKCGSPTMVLTFPWVVGLPGVVFTFSVGRGPPRVTRGEDLCPSSSKLLFSCGFREASRRRLKMGLDPDTQGEGGGEWWEFQAGGRSAGWVWQWEV